MGGPLDFHLSALTIFITSVDSSCNTPCRNQGNAPRSAIRRAPRPRLACPAQNPPPHHPFHRPSSVGPTSRAARRTRKTTDENEGCRKRKRTQSFLKTNAVVNKNERSRSTLPSQPLKYRDDEGEKSFRQRKSGQKRGEAPRAAAATSHLRLLPKRRVMVLSEKSAGNISSFREKSVPLHLVNCALRPARTARSERDRINPPKLYRKDF